MNLPFFIAKRYLISKKSHNAINIISGISVTGVCIGTMALVIVLSAFNGLSDLVQSLYNSFDSDILITAKVGKTFDPNTTEIQALKNIQGVAFYTDVMEGNVLLKFNDKQIIATIKGVGSEFEQMSRFDTLLCKGNFNVAKNNIIIGKGISNVLETGPNDFYTPITMYAPKRGNINTINPEDEMNESNAFPAGVFSINDDFDYKYVITNIDKARALLDYTTEVTSIEMKLLPTANKEEVQANIIKTVGDKYDVKNRYQQNALLYKTLKSEKLWTFIILMFIMIIATFNIIGSLTMLIIEKKKDITILSNMGADVSLIRRIFLFEGLLITILGILFGLILGLLVCWFQVKFSLIKLSEGYVVNAYPIKVEWMDIFLIICSVMVIGFFAAWYPVRYFTKKHLLAVS